eukprot:6188144-Pleurochrysis_carterae.AAC.1
MASDHYKISFIVVQLTVQPESATFRTEAQNLLTWLSKLANNVMFFEKWLEQGVGHTNMFPCDATFQQARDLRARQAGKIQQYNAARSMRTATTRSFRFLSLADCAEVCLLFYVRKEMLRWCSRLYTTSVVAFFFHFWHGAKLSVGRSESRGAEA